MPLFWGLPPLDYFSFGNHGINSGTYYKLGDLDFDGITAHIKISDSNSLVFTNSFTLNAWVYPTTVCRDFIIGKTKGFMVNGMELEWGWTTVVKPAVQWFGSDFTYGETLTYPIENQWNYVGATYDGTDVIYYLNGAADGGYTPSNPPPNTTYPLKIGTFDDRVSTYDFEGIISEVSISNIVFTVDQIALFHDRHWDLYRPVARIFYSIPEISVIFTPRIIMF